MTNEGKNKAMLDEASLKTADLEFGAALAKITRGMSPIEPALAIIDWSAHLAIAPGKRKQLRRSLIAALKSAGKYSASSLSDKDTPGPARSVEFRMRGEAWEKWPFNALAHTHQSIKEWWDEAVEGVDGVSPRHTELVHAMVDQLLDALSPANGLLTNPEVLNTTIAERGRNLRRGLGYFFKDRWGKRSDEKVADDEAFKVGRDIAVTPGKVVFQNELIELIQYEPVTQEVGAEPVLICPAWIMKYYILDLSPHNSLVRYLTEQGKTVFAISWKNPDEEDRNTGFEDYIHHGSMAAIDAVNSICPGRKINAVGYCIGGTLLSVTAAAMAGADDDRLNSISLFAAQTDFSEAGEITRFVSPSQLALLEKSMWKRGYLDSASMGRSFGALRASDLIYGAMVDRYLLGKEARPNDLMSWNADGTRMPYRMHSEYLQKLYLDNELAQNKFTVAGKTVSLSDITAPLFVVGTETDHVAPWKSVFKLHGLTHGELTFLLTSGGHNAGIVSGPSHPRRRYRVHTRKPGDKFIAADDWLESLEPQQGSWWPVWDAWLDQQMSEKKKPPAMAGRGKALSVIRDAPGEYVFG